MLDAVFYDGLQQQSGYGPRAQVSGQVEVDLQPISHTHAHQREVVAQAIKFALKRVRRSSGSRKRGSQIVVQAIKHRDGLRRLGRDQRTQVGQRVEQHVRF